MLLADDIVLCSETVVGLKNQLNSLNGAARRLHLRVNLDKSNIIVFRKGGYLSERERWFYDGSIMPVVNVYKYLGTNFSTKLSFNAACKDISSKAKKALLYVIQRLRLYNNSSLNIFLQIFDCQIQPIMQYGSEVWGLDGASNCCENVHLYGLKKYLNVDNKTPNDLVYSELGRYPITINSAINCIRYWIKLTEMENHRLPKRAYNTLYNLDARGKQTWATKVRLCLMQNGFGYAWFNQGVGNANLFLKIIKQRLIDCRWQNVKEHINNSDRFRFYSLICEKENTLPTYLETNVERHLKRIMTKLCFGVTEISTHFYRYRPHSETQLLCPYCKSVKEDGSSLHFILFTI